MKKKQFRHGTTLFGHSYLKSSGHGWEAGLHIKGQKIFVGNFIHAKEANAWFRQMNQEVTAFGKRFPVGEKYPTQWFAKFVGHNLYKKYYAFLDKQFSKYNREYTKAVNQDIRKYKKLKNKWSRKELRPFYKKAA